MVYGSGPTNKEFCLLLCDMRYKVYGMVLNQYRIHWLNCKNDCIMEYPF